MQITCSLQYHCTRQALLSDNKKKKGSLIISDFQYVQVLCVAKHILFEKYFQQPGNPIKPEIRLFPGKIRMECQLSSILETLSPKKAGIHLLRSRTVSSNVYGVKSSLANIKWPVKQAY